MALLSLHNRTLQLGSSSLTNKGKMNPTAPTQRSWLFMLSHAGQELLRYHEYSNFINSHQITAVSANDRSVYCFSLSLNDEGKKFLTASSCLMCSMVASSARVPLVASSSTAFTVFSRDVTFVTITY